MAGRKIEFVSPEEMFGIPKSDSTEEKSSTEEDILVDIDKILDWHTELNIPGVKVHPFNRLSEAKKLELKKSIERNGLISPIILREDIAPGYYEAIAGHNRRDVLKELGFKTLSKKKHQIRILENCDDVLAAYWMLDSNIQRDEMLPSEKADVYASKYELIRKELKTNPELMSHYGTSKRSDEIAAELIGISRTTLQRYLALKKLISDLMDLTDRKKISVPVAELMASLDKDQQGELYEAIKESKIPGLSVIKQIKAACNERTLMAAELCEMISPAKSSYKVDLKPIFKSAEKAFEDLQITDADQIDDSALERVVTDAIREYLSQFITGNEKI